MTRDEESTNDEFQMTKEARRTNYRKRPAEEQVAGEAEASWEETLEVSVSKLREEPNDWKRVFDLEERTARFGEAIIGFAKKIPLSPVNNRLIEQLVGAGTSVGANYCEADDGVWRKDYKNKFGPCRKRGTRNQVLPADGGHRRTEPETRGPDSLAGSQRTAPDLQPHQA